MQGVWRQGRVKKVAKISLYWMRRRLAMAADPRWLEVLKASGGQSLAPAVACGGLLAGHYYHVIPALG